MNGSFEPKASTSLPKLFGAMAISAKAHPGAILQSKNS
jgi:hypothetical protein